MSWGRLKVNVLSYCRGQPSAIYDIICTTFLWWYNFRRLKVIILYIFLKIKLTYFGTLGYITLWHLARFWIALVKLVSEEFVWMCSMISWIGQDCGMLKVLLWFVTCFRISALSWNVKIIGHYMTFSQFMALGDHWGLALHFPISIVKLFHFPNHLCWTMYSVNV